MFESASLWIQRLKTIISGDLRSTQAAIGLRQNSSNAMSRRSRQNHLLLWHAFARFHRQWRGRRQYIQEIGFSTCQKLHSTEMITIATQQSQPAFNLIRLQSAVLRWPDPSLTMANVQERSTATTRGTTSSVTIRSFEASIKRTTNECKYK